MISEIEEQARKSGFLYDKVDNIILLLGDCLEIMSHECLRNRIEVIITSPPYNEDIKYSLYDDDLELDHYLKFMSNFFATSCQAMKEEASLFLNFGGEKRPLTKHHVVIEASKIFSLQNELVWVKSIVIDAFSKGHYKPINSQRYLNRNYEQIFHFTKKGNVEINRLAVGVQYKYISNIARFKQSQNKHCSGNVWYIPYNTIRSRSKDRNHPATFPIELPRRCILLHGKRDIVCDPFVGLGNTLLAAQALNLPAIGIDIDKEYLKETLSRLKKVHRGYRILDFGEKKEEL